MMHRSTHQFLSFELCLLEIRFVRLFPAGKRIFYLSLTRGFSPVYRQ